MKLKISEAKLLILNYCDAIGYQADESEAICENLLEAELRGKKSHGIWRLLIHEAQIQYPESPSSSTVKFQKRTKNSMLVNGGGRTGYYVMSKALGKAINMCKDNGIYTFSLTNTQPSLGVVGVYAEKVAMNDLIYIGFSNCEGGLVPYSCKKDIFGTNPFTIGVPGKKSPIVMDMSSSKLNWGDLHLMNKKNERLPEKTAINKFGEFTLDPKEVLNGGGLLPFGGNKGSSLAFMIEILSGVLSGSRAGNSFDGGWGNLSILINPSIFIDTEEFKENIVFFINKYKETPTFTGELFYPGEKSYSRRMASLDSGYIEVDSDLVKRISSVNRISDILRKYRC